MSGKKGKKTQMGDEDLCEALGIETRTLTRWRKLADAPKPESEAAWKEFKVRHGLGRAASQTKTELQEAKLREEIALLKLKRAREEGATVLVSDVREFLGQMAARHAQLLRMRYDTELPAKLAGKDMVGIRRTIAGTTDDVGETVNRGLLEWTPAS